MIHSLVFGDKSGVANTLDNYEKNHDLGMSLFLIFSRGKSHYLLPEIDSCSAGDYTQYKALL